MRRNLFLSLVCAGAFFCMQPAFAQSPGGGGGMPSQGQSTPSTPGQSPGMSGAGGGMPEAAPRQVDDKKFMKDAAMGGMTEVELGKLAAQKGTSDDVKQFGQ